MSKRLDRSELETRRIEGGKLLQRGVRPAEVARRLNVSRTSVGRWQLKHRRRSDRSGRALLFSPGRPVVAGRDKQRRFWAAIAALGTRLHDANAKGATR